MAIIYPMHLHNDSSLSDLLPWQTSESHSPQINFIHSHLAAIAKMVTQKPDKIVRSQPLSQQRRHTTLVTTSSFRRGQQQPLNKSQNQARVNTSSPQKFRQKNFLHQSLQEDKLEKIMQTTECSSPIRVTQVNTEQTTLNSSKNDLQGERSRYNSERRLRNSVGRDTQKVFQKMTFAQFLFMKNKEERGKKTSISKERDVLYRGCEFGIHVRAMEQKQIHLHQSDTWKVADGGKSSKAVEASRSVKDRRKFVSSKKVSVKLKEVQCLSSEIDFSQNFKGVWIHT